MSGLKRVILLSVPGSLFSCWRCCYFCLQMVTGNCMMPMLCIPEFKGTRWAKRLRLLLWRRCHRFWRDAMGTGSSSWVGTVYLDKVKWSTANSCMSIQKMYEIGMNISGKIAIPFFKGTIQITFKYSTCSPNTHTKWQNIKPGFAAPNYLHIYMFTVRLELNF